MKFSRWGLIASGAYILFVGWLFYYSANCIGGFCGLMAFLATMPWLLIFGFIGIDIYSSTAWQIVAVVLNITLLYLLFAWIEKRMKRQ